MLEDGVWRTINGVHVLIGKDGSILKGPKKLQKSNIQERLKKQFNSKGEKLQLTNDDKAKIYNQIKDSSYIIKNYNDWKIQTSVDDAYDYVFNVRVYSPSVDDAEIYHYNIKSKKVTGKND